MGSKDTELEAEAIDLFNCDKNLINYLVESAGSIGPSKITENKKANKNQTRT